MLCNPLSGRLQGRLEAVRALGREIAPDTYHEASTPGEIASALLEIGRGHCDVLGIVGGDGTIQAALTALHAQRPTGPWPALALTAAGSTNMTARDLGTRGTMDRGLEALRALHRPEGGIGTRVQRPMLCVQRPNHDILCGMFFGAAVISDGVRFFRQRLRGLPMPGERTSILSVLRVLLSLGIGRSRRKSAGCPIKVQVDGGVKTTHTATICLASTLHRLLLGSRPYWGNEDGPLHFTVVDSDARAFWRSVWRVARGRPGKRLTPERGYFSHEAHEVRLTLDGPFVLDGELFEADPRDGPCILTAPRTVEWIVS